MVSLRQTVVELFISVPSVHFYAELILHYWNQLVMSLSRKDVGINVDVNTLTVLGHCGYVIHRL